MMKKQKIIYQLSYQIPKENTRKLHTHHVNQLLLQIEREY